MKKLIIILSFILLLIPSSLFADAAVIGEVAVLLTDFTQDSNCQLALLMDADEDPVTDSSQNSNHGSLLGAGEPNYTATGKYGGGYIFDGSDDYIDLDAFVGMMNLGAGTSFSYGFWFKPSSTWNSASGTHGILQGDTTDEDSWASHLNVILTQDEGEEGALNAWHQDGAGPVFAAVYSTNQSWTSGTWYHIAIVYDATNDDLEMWINGTMVAEDTSASDPLYTDLEKVRLGGNSAGSTFIDVTLDEIFFFDRQLSGTEINEIMDHGLDGTH